MARDAPEDLGNYSSSATKSQIGIKKGPWTATEDMTLVDYVKKHGEGNWNAVQQNSGLMRCGKSCRLRWANHLRPNLKKGAFSVEEEKLIVQLHAKLGNKWARMAAQLPGRTDNEIKNYWNTRLKRRQRAGLPIYPQDVLENQQPLNSSPLLVSYESPNPYTSPFNFSPISILPLETNKPRLNLCQANTGNLGLHLATSDSSFPPSPPPTLRHNNPLAMNYSFLGYNNNPLSYKILELPLIQSPGTTIDSSSDVQSAAAELGFSRTGLLGDLFGESKGLVRTRKFEKEFITAVGNYGVNGNDNENASANCNKNEGKEITSAQGKGISPIEDDLLRELLNNFPMSVPIPEWNDGQYAGSESSIMVNGATALAQVQPLGSTYNSPPEGKGTN